MQLSVLGHVCLELFIGLHTVRILLTTRGRELLKYVDLLTKIRQLS